MCQQRKTERDQQTSHAGRRGQLPERGQVQAWGEGKAVLKGREAMIMIIILLYIFYTKCWLEETRHAPEIIRDFVC